MLGIEPRDPGGSPRERRRPRMPLRAIGCDVAQIVKSLVFMADGRPVIAFTSGANRVDPSKLAAIAGASEARRASPEEARAATGFAVGGTPPFGHPASLPVLRRSGSACLPRGLGRSGNTGLGVPAVTVGTPAGHGCRNRRFHREMTATEGRIWAMTATGDTMAQTAEETQHQKSIQLTETAAGEVQKLITEEGRPEIALRIAVQPGGCSGLRYAMYLDDQVSEKDLLEEQFGVKVVVDKMSVPVPHAGHHRLGGFAGGLGVHDRQPGGAEFVRLRPLVPLAP